MIIYAASQSNELDRFVGKDVWVKSIISTDNESNPLYFWVRIISCEYDDELAQEGYRVNIYPDGRTYTEDIWDRLINTSSVITKGFLTPVKPYEVLLTDELMEMLS